MLVSLLIVPLIGSLLLLLVPENNPKNEEKMKVIALSTSLVNLLISILLWIQFDSSVISRVNVHKHELFEALVT